MINGSVRNLKTPREENHKSQKPKRCSYKIQDEKFIGLCQWIQFLCICLINSDFMRRWCLNCADAVWYYNTYIHVYIYIYMAVLSVLSLTTSFVSCPLPLSYSPLNSMCSLVTLQVSQAATDFTTELAQPFSFAYSDIIWVLDRFCTFTQIAFETSKR